MGMTRREFGMVASAIFLGRSGSSRAAPTAVPAVSVVLAP